MRTVTLWTCQHPRVLAELMTTGRYRFKEKELKEKSGSASEYYKRMYNWYTRTAGKFIAIPEGCPYPIWLAPEKERLLPEEGAMVYLRLEIPEDQVLRCNISAWEYRMDGRYIPSSAEDAQAHTQELTLWGAGSDYALIHTHTGNFYPHLRRKIENSWDRVFTQLNVSPGIIAFTAWELRKEWIEDIRMEIQVNTGYSQ